MEMIETETKVVVLNEQPEFSACGEEDVSASYFILCEDDKQTSLSKNVYDFKIAGMSILNWVVRVCDNQPTILKVLENDNVLDVIKNGSADEANIWLNISFDPEFSHFSYEQRYNFGSQNNLLVILCILQFYSKSYGSIHQNFDH